MGQQVAYSASNSDRAYKTGTAPISTQLEGAVKPSNLGTFTIPEAKVKTKYGGWAVSPVLVDRKVGDGVRRNNNEANNSIDAFGMDNVRKLRQMGFTPDQILSYIDINSKQSRLQETIRQIPVSEEEITEKENVSTENTPSSVEKKRSSFSSRSSFASRIISRGIKINEKNEGKEKGNNNTNNEVTTETVPSATKPVRTVLRKGVTPFAFSGFTDKTQEGQLSSKNNSNNKATISNTEITEPVFDTNLHKEDETDPATDAVINETMDVVKSVTQFEERGDISLPVSLSNTHENLDTEAIEEPVPYFSSQEDQTANTVNLSENALEKDDKRKDEEAIRATETDTTNITGLPDLKVSGAAPRDTHTPRSNPFLNRLAGEYREDEQADNSEAIESRVITQRNNEDVPRNKTVERVKETPEVTIETTKQEAMKTLENKRVTMVDDVLKNNSERWGTNWLQYISPNGITFKYAKKDDIITTLVNAEVVGTVENIHNWSDELVDNPVYEAMTSKVQPITEKDLITRLVPSCANIQNPSSWANVSAFSAYEILFGGESVYGLSHEARFEISMLLKNLGGIDEAAEKVTLHKKYNTITQTYSDYFKANQKVTIHEYYEEVKSRILEANKK